MNLSKSAFDILLSLAHGPRHGYAMIQAIADWREGQIMQPGLLYTTLPKLLDAGLIEETKAEKGADKRRRYYRLTHAGRLAMQAEASSRVAQAQRLQQIAGGVGC